MHPGFFGTEGIRALPENRVYTELVLDLRENLSGMQPCDCPERITFGEYRGDFGTLRDAVRQVEEDWVQYFNPGDRVFCASDGSRIAAFCILDDMGRHLGLHIGGPGCVGTLPEYRRQGIGLETVRRATLILRGEGFDLSWIHYTHLEQWYGKLGYRKVLEWNRNGLLPEKTEPNGFMG